MVKINIDMPKSCERCPLLCADDYLEYCCCVDNSIDIGCDGRAENCPLTPLEPQPSDDCISRAYIEPIIEELENICVNGDEHILDLLSDIKNAPSLTPTRVGHCKDCKYFEYDSAAKVDGIPLIVAHEICSRWGDGCKTKEDGYCFLFEPQESEDKE